MNLSTLIVIGSWLLEFEKLGLDSFGSIIEENIPSELKARQRGTLGVLVLTCRSSRALT